MKLLSFCAVAAAAALSLSIDRIFFLIFNAFIMQAEKKFRWEKAKREREAEAAEEEIKIKAANEAAADDDPLAGFLNEVKEQVHAPVGFQVSQ